MINRGRVHLALVTETFPPEVNGVAMTLGRVSRGLIEHGWTVDVVRPRQLGEPEGPFPTQHPSITTTLVPGVPLPFYRTLRMGLPLSGRLRSRWQSARPDVVHVATEGPLGWAALSAARALGIPVSSSFHTNFHQYGGHYGLRLGRNAALRYLRWFHNRTRLTLAPTEEMCGQLRAQGFANLRVMARGVDGVMFHPGRRSSDLRRSWGVDSDAPVVLHVGRLAAEKNLGLAIEAFRVFKKRIPEAKFVWVGDGPERVRLARANPEFIFVGMRRGEELAAHYASADVFVFPSVTETFGNVVTEAMASGLATLAYDYAAARAYLSKPGAGLVAPFRDREQFLRVADQLAASRDEWPSWSVEARRRAETITWGNVVRDFAADLERVRAAPAVK